jgi:hypothetical protein
MNTNKTKMMIKKINKDLIENVEMVRHPIVEEWLKFVKQPLRIRILNFLRGIKSKDRIRGGSLDLFFNYYVDDVDKFFIENRDTYFNLKGVVYRNPHIVVKMVSGDDYIKHFIKLKDMDKWLYDNLGDMKFITINHNKYY